MFLSKRNGVYYLWFKRGQKWAKASCRTHLKSEALRFVREFDSSMPSRKPISITLEQFLAQYLNHAANTISPKTYRDYMNRLHRFLGFAGNKLLEQVSVKDIDTYKVYLMKQGAKPNSTNVYLQILHCAFETAVRWEHMKSNPVKKVARLKVQKMPPAFMTQDQIKKFFETLPEFWRRLFLFALLTGCRVSEIVSLRWEDVDLPGRTIRIGSKHFTTKTKKVRIVPMHNVLLAMLEEMKSLAKSYFVFSKINGMPYDPSYVSNTFRMYRRACGLPSELHLHSIRHTFASLLVSSGVPIYSVSKLLGHSSVAMTQIYSHLLPEHLSNEVQKIQIPE
jgi:integrase